jgi:hypothetical protein
MAVSRRGLGSCHLLCRWLHPTSFGTGVRRYVMHRSPVLLPILLCFAAGFCVAQTQGSAAPNSLPQAAPTVPTGDAPATTQPPPKNPADAREPEAQPSPQPPQEPKTEILDSSATSAALATDGHDPILDPPPFPRGITTLVGGIISGVDRIRNHLTVSIFGDRQWTVYFDERTHIFHNGAEVTSQALKKGERVYVDTMLDNNNRDIFARNIRVGVVSPAADAAGQIEEVDFRRHQFVLRDNINSSSVRFAVDSATRIIHDSKPATFRDLATGSLVHVQFASDQPNRGLAREIVILAVPGSAFTFAGSITFLDTHRNLLSVRNTADNKTYDIFFVPSRTDAAGRLAVGAEVQVVAIFDATHYAAQRITVTRMAGAAH